MTDYEMDSRPQTTASAYPQADVAFYTATRRRSLTRHAEIDGPTSIAEDDARDPERTFVALLVISKTALHKPIW